MDLKNILRETCLSSTIHGIPNILRTNSICLKVLWSIFTILSSSACFYLVIEAVTQFLEHEVVTKMIVTNEFSSEFPAIKICLKNKYLDDNGNNFLKSIVELVEQNTIPKGQILERFVKKCEFNSLPCDLENDFNFSSFCLVYNSVNNQNFSKLKEIKRVGKKNGLKLKIFTGGAGIKGEDNTTGVLINIFNSSINSFIILDDFIDVSTGLETNIIVNRLIINKKERPHSQCVSDLENYDSDLIKLFLRHGLWYEQKTCSLLLGKILIALKYNCSIDGILNMNDRTPCKHIVDVDKASDILLSLEENKKFREEKCPLECDSYQLNPLIYHGIGDEEIQSNKGSMLSLNIYYDSLSYTTITETAKTEWIDLISNIGGTLGLFIGISFLTFGEIFEIIILHFLSLIEKKKKTFFKNKIQLDSQKGSPNNRLTF